MNAILDATHFIYPSLDERLSVSSAIFYGNGKIKRWNTGNIRYSLVEPVALVSLETYEIFLWKRFFSAN